MFHIGIVIMSKPSDLKYFSANRMPYIYTMRSESKRFDTIIRTNKILSSLIARPGIYQGSFDGVLLRLLRCLWRILETKFCDVGDGFARFRHQQRFDITLIQILYDCSSLVDIFENLQQYHGGS